MSEISRRWLVRRVLVNEINELKRIQRVAPRLYDDYPFHDDWVKQACSQVATGERIAFGIYVSVIEHPKNEDVNSKLAFSGSVILKQRLYGDSVELKNFLIDTQNFDSEKELKDAQVGLLEKAYSYCERRAFNRISIEIPPRETKMIAFFHEQGFKISSIVSSRYRMGDFFYLMVKELHPKYSGDPFDFLGMVDWILQNRLRCFRDKGPVTKYIDDDTSEYVFSRTLEMPFAQDTFDGDLKKNAVINANCLIIIDEDCPDLRGDLFPNHPGTRLVFADSYDPAIEEFCKKNAAISFLRHKVRALLDSRHESVQIYFDKSHIGGAVISVGPQNYNKLVEFSRERRKLAYFLWWGGYGRYAHLTTSGKQKNIVIFHFPITPEDSAGLNSDGVYFIAELENCIHEKNGVVWEDYANCATLMEKEDFLLFSRHTDKSDVVVLLCSKLSHIEAGPNFFDLVERIEGEDAHDFYKSNMTASGVLTNYISSELRDSFLKEYIPQGIISSHGDEKQVFPLSEQYFDIAFSYPRGCEDKVKQISDEIRKIRPRVSMFIDFEREDDLATADRISKLMNIYKKQTKLIVALFGLGYDESKWCGLEWESILEVIHLHDNKGVMFLAIDDTRPKDFSGAWGVLSVKNQEDHITANQILKKLRELG